jgi:hypothetical protein
VTFTIIVFEKCDDHPREASSGISHVSLGMDAIRYMSWCNFLDEQLSFRDIDARPRWAHCDCIGERFPAISVKR